MPAYTNFTRFSVGEIAGFDPEGAEFYALIVKATFVWGEDGAVELADAPQPLIETDVFTGDPASTGLLFESDFTPFKPRCDVLVCGALALPVEVEQVEATLQVGRRIRKTVRVIGDRHWTLGTFSTVTMTRPRPFRRMPISWDRSFGGTDPEDPKHYEPRNPVGCGKRKQPKRLEGQRAPNFEHPRQPLEPIGFGPVGRSFRPRVDLAGTYDAKWQEEHFPLPPPDFDPRYHNCAPEDQQLDQYPAGEEVRLEHMTARGHDRFVLPRFEVPVRFGEYPARYTDETIVPDTVILEPAEGRFSLVGRHCHFPKPDVLALRQVLVGTPPRGFVRADEAQKIYLDFRKSATGRS
jgi:hypothetical protein